MTLPQTMCQRIRAMLRLPVRPISRSITPMSSGNSAASSCKVLRGIRNTRQYSVRFRVWGVGFKFVGQG